MGAVGARSASKAVGKRRRRFPRAGSVHRPAASERRVGSSRASLDERGLEPAAVRRTFTHEFVGVAGEAIDRALRAHGVGESREPLVGSTIARDDHGSGAVAFVEDRVRVTALGEVRRGRSRR